MLSDSSQHSGSDFVSIMKGPSVIRISETAKFFVRTALRQYAPSYSEKCLANDAGPGAGPPAHAMARTKLIVFGGSSLDCSTSSATARSAIAYALTAASCRVAPYAIAPGISGISAIQRPSVSRSVCMLNRKSRLLVPCAGLRGEVFTVIGCNINRFAARNLSHERAEAARRRIPDLPASSALKF